MRYIILPDPVWGLRSTRGRPPGSPPPCPPTRLNGRKVPSGLTPGPDWTRIANLLVLGVCALLHLLHSQPRLPPTDWHWNCNSIRVLRRVRLLRASASTSSARPDPKDTAGHCATKRPRQDPQHATRRLGPWHICPPQGGSTIQRTKKPRMDTACRAVALRPPGRPHGASGLPVISPDPQITKIHPTSPSHRPTHQPTPSAHPTNPRHQPIPPSPLQSSRPAFRWPQLPARAAAGAPADAPWPHAAPCQ